MCSQNGRGATAGWIQSILANKRENNRRMGGELLQDGVVLNSRMSIQRGSRVCCVKLQNGSANRDHSVLVIEAEGAVRPPWKLINVRYNRQLLSEDSLSNSKANLK